MNILVPGSLLQGGKYRIIRPIDMGWCDVTYLAEQVVQGRMVCIKEFFIREDCDHDENGNVIIRHPQERGEWVLHFLEKFLERANILSRLEHPNLVKIHEVFMENNTAYYVMDYIEGETLSDLVRHNGALPEQTAVQYITGIAGALKLMHAEGINHLEVMPGHIIRRKCDGEVLLFGFGYDEFYDDNSNPEIATPLPRGIYDGYSPIEIYDFRRVLPFSPQTDIFSLGATLYRLLLGQRPPSAGDLIEEGLHFSPSSVSSGVQNAVRAAMQVRMKARPKDIDEWLRILMSEDMPESPKVGLLSRLKSFVKRK